MKPTTGVAFARAGLLGNPGDGYGGKALAISVCDFAARVEIRPAAHFAFRGGPAEASEFDSLGDALRGLRANGCYDGMRLLRASLLRFARHVGELDAIPPTDARMKFELSYETTIPRQVGLSGSSAIVVAALRALSSWFETPLAPHDLAELALAAEVEELGIAAGPMDRVIQAYEGVVHMQLAPPRSPASYRRIDPALLPPLFVAWDPRGGEASGVVHNDVRQRWEQGEPRVREAIARFPRLVDEGMKCLEAGDIPGFQKRVNENFDTRASIWTLAARDLELVRLGRERGAAVKFAGSGGAVVGVMRDAGEFGEIEAAYRDAGFDVLMPRVVPP